MSSKSNLPHNLCDLPVEQREQIERDKKQWLEARKLVTAIFERDRQIYKPSSFGVAAARCNKELLPKVAGVLASDLIRTKKRNDIRYFLQCLGESPFKVSLRNSLNKKDQ